MNKINKLQEDREWLLKKINDPMMDFIYSKRGNFPKVDEAYCANLKYTTDKLIKEQKHQDAKNILIGRQEDYLDLSGSREEMPIKDLLIKDNPNLETLIVDNCLLEKIKVVNCPKLKTLSCRHNYRISEIDISECPSLEGLYASNNKLTNLDLSKNLNLKHLTVDNNRIKNLNLKHLEKLESLYCLKCGLAELDVSGLKNLKEIYCAEQSTPPMTNIKIEGCENLIELDCAENFIKELDISNLANLEFVSCRENSLESIISYNNPKLRYFDKSLQIREEKKSSSLDTATLEEFKNMTSGFPKRKKPKFNYRKNKVNPEPPKSKTTENNNSTEPKTEQKTSTSHQENNHQKSNNQDTSLTSPATTNPYPWIISGITIIVFTFIYAFLHFKKKRKKRC